MVMASVNGVLWTDQQAISNDPVSAPALVSVPIMADIANFIRSIRSATMKDVSMAAYSNLPPGMEPGLEATDYYDPPEMTYPFGAYPVIRRVVAHESHSALSIFYRRWVTKSRCSTMIDRKQRVSAL